MFSQSKPFLSGSETGLVGHLINRFRILFAKKDIRPPFATGAVFLPGLK